MQLPLNECYASHDYDKTFGRVFPMVGSEFFGQERWRREWNLYNFKLHDDQLLWIKPSELFQIFQNVGQGLCDGRNISLCDSTDL